MCFSFSNLNIQWKSVFCSKYRSKRFLWLDFIWACGVSNYFVTDPLILHWLVPLLIWFPWWEPESDKGVIKSTTWSYNKNPARFFLTRFHFSSMQYVGLRNTAELVALQGNWSSSPLLLPTCPQSSSGEKEDIVFYSASVVHSSSKTTSYESHSITTNTYFKSVRMQTNSVWPHTHKSLKSWWNAVNFLI